MRLKTYIIGLLSGLVLFYLPLLPFVFRSGSALSVMPFAPFTILTEAITDLSVHPAEAATKMLVQIALFLSALIPPLFQRAGRLAIWSGLAGWSMWMIYLLWNLVVLAAGC